MPPRNPQPPRRLCIKFNIPETAQIGLLQRLVECGATDIDFEVEEQMPHYKNQPRQLAQQQQQQYLLPGPHVKQPKQQPHHPSKRKRTRRGLAGSKTPTLLRSLKEKFQDNTFYRSDLQAAFAESGLAPGGFENWIHRALKDTKIIKKVHDKYALNVNLDELSEPNTEG